VTEIKPAEQIAAHFALLAKLEPESEAVRFNGKGYSWGELGAIADGLAQKFDALGLPEFACVGWLARNEPSLVGALIGLIQSRHCISPLNPHQPAEKTAEQQRQLNMGVVVGVAQDFTPELKTAMKDVGAVGLVLEIGADDPVRFVPGFGALGKGPFRSLGQDVVAERLTSGTTGEPKRIPVPAVTFAKAMQLGARSEKNKAAEPLKVKRSPAILQTTFSHSGGMWGALLSLNQARPIDLHDKFTPEAWADAVERTKTRVSSLVPSMITMVLEADIPPEKLASLMAIRCGTAALDPETQKRFEDHFNVPVLVEYGASEFMGGIAGWSLADHKAHGQTKRGSVGRMRPDMEVRITGSETNEDLPAGEIGILNLKTPRAGPDWIRTTDLASIDAEGFLYLHGRVDEAINRGGFKVLPDKVAEVLRLHPGVREVGILAAKHARLGQVPIAIIEPSSDASKPTSEEMNAFGREQMAAYMVPVAFEFVESLPRTLSMKVDRPALRKMFQDKYDL
jgi:acyl-CoA synthetase (AMP-forming)/AMP-acid ligase II